MNYIAEIIFAVSYGSLMGIMITSAIQIKNFLKENSTISDEYVLARFKKIANYNHYLAMFFGIVVIVPLLVSCIMIVQRYGGIGYLIVISVVATNFALGRYLKKFEKEICTLPINADKPDLEIEYQKIVHKWLKKYSRATLLKQEQEEELTIEKESTQPNPLVLNITSTLCWLIGGIIILTGLALFIPSYQKIGFSFYIWSIFFIGIGLCIAGYGLRKRKVYAGILSLICNLLLCLLHTKYTIASIIIIILTLLNWKNLGSGKRKINYSSFIRIACYAALGIGVSIGYNKYQEYQDDMQKKATQESAVSWILQHPNLTSFVVGGFPVAALQDLSFIKNFKKIDRLDLDLGQVSDLSFLAELPNLTTLKLDLDAVYKKPKINSLSFLQPLKSLKSLSLNLWESPIADIQALGTLTELTTLELNLDRSGVTDISVLKSLTKLTKLNLKLYSSKVKDISSLKELKNLTQLTLNLEYTELRDLTVLTELPQLVELNLIVSSLDSKELESIKKLAQLKSLTLRVQNYPFDNINFLTDLKELETLSLSFVFNNKFYFDTLKELPKLTSLTLLSALNNENIASLGLLDNLTSLDIFIPEDIKNIAFLAKLKNLTTLHLTLALNFSEPKKVIDMLPLQELNNLTTLELDYDLSGIKDVGFLTKLKNLTTLTLRSRDIEDLSGLKQLEKLTTLNIDVVLSNINDISVLGDMKNLTNLNLKLARSHLKDLTPLKKLTQLQSLRLEAYNSEVTDISFLSELTNLVTLNLNAGSAGESNVSLTKLVNLNSLTLSSSQLPILPLPDKLTALSFEDTSLKEGLSF